jgi:hypothetical protein
MWYAERYNETGSWYYMAGGLLASLWTPETYVQTAVTLATAPYVAAKIAAAGAQSAAAAARVAVKEVVEEAIGVPIPGKGKSFASKKGLGANPFKGKTPEQIDKILTERGFIKKGPDPVSGKGSYFHPESGRKYYLDSGGKYKKGTELPHVDVHRMKDGQNLEHLKRKYPLGESLYE